MELVQEGLHEITNTTDPNRLCDIVFVHGLAGGSHSTWRNDNGFFWPTFLGNELPNAGIWSVGYAAGISDWFGAAGMPIQDRAQNVLAKMRNRGLGSQPIIFIMHSMGGLIIKQLIVQSLVQKQPEIDSFVKSIRGLVFCGTPHRGADLAHYAKVMTLFFRPQDHLKQMAINDPMLDTLHDGFLKWQNDTRTPVMSFVEKVDLFRKGWLFNVSIGQAVPQVSGNPGIVDCECTPVLADHIALVKPDSRNHDVYAGTKRFVSQILQTIPRPNPDASPETEANDRLLRLISDNIDILVSFYKKTKDRFPVFKWIDTTMTIESNGDSVMEERAAFEGVPDRPQNYFGLLFQSNKPISYHETGFELTCHSSDYQIAFLPSGIRTNNLSVILMFLPPVAAGKSPIDFSHRQSAKGAFREFVDPKIKTDYYQTSVRSDQSVPQVRIRFRVAESLGPVRLEKIGSSYGGEITKMAQMPDPGYRSYFWEAEQVPDGGEIAVRLVRI